MTRLRDTSLAVYHEENMLPLAIDLFCGLGGWTEGLLAEGYQVVGFDNERHQYGDAKYPAQLVIQDVLTLHGSQFKNADLIVASPPCQEYSYMAMPWSIAKQKAREYRDGVRDVKQLTALFDACFRIQREACEAAGRHIPLVVENVCGAQKWIGRARWHFGSFYLWGDVPALMPIAAKAIKVSTMGAGWYPPASPKHVPGLAFNTHAERATKNTGGSWFNIAHNTTSGKAQNHVNTPAKSGICIHGVHWSAECRECGIWRVYPSDGVKVASEAGRRTDIGKGARFTSQDCGGERKNGGDWFGSGENCSLQRRQSSKGSARKAASAHIAKIPLALSRHIAKAWKPK